MRTDFPGRGPHTLTGPIYIEEAQPGDVLKVTLNKIVPRAYATNFNVPGLFGQFPLSTRTARSSISISTSTRCRPNSCPASFYRCARSPAHSPSRARSRAAIQACRPVSTPATWISVTSSPAHRSMCRSMWRGVAVDRRLYAGQGNGEVNLTAIETAYKEFNITVDVIKGKPLDFPRIETKKSWITMGFDQDLNKAWAQTKAQTIKFLSEQRKVSAEQAEKLMPSVSDCRVSQVVNIKKGIHRLNPKNTSDKEDMERPTKETSKYYVAHAKDADLNKAMNDASMGMIKLLEVREEDRAARCVWT